MFEHFKSIYGIEPESLNGQQQNPSSSETQTNADLDGEITETELKHAIFYQKNNKSSGARFTKRFKTNFILCLNLGLISV